MYDDDLKAAGKTTDAFPAVRAEISDTAVDGLPPIPVEFSHQPAHRRTFARRSWAGPAAGMAAVLAASAVSFLTAYELATPPHRPQVATPPTAPTPTETTPSPTPDTPTRNPPGPSASARPTRAVAATAAPESTPSPTSPTPMPPAPTPRTPAPTPAISKPSPSSPPPNPTNSATTTASATPSTASPEATDDD